MSNSEHSDTNEITNVLMILNSCSELVANVVNTSAIDIRKNRAQQLVNSSACRLIHLNKSLHEYHDPMSTGGYTITDTEFQSLRDIVLLIIKELTNLLDLEDPKPEEEKLKLLCKFHKSRLTTYRNRQGEQDGKE